MAKMVQNYILLEVAGRGQFGEVYQARHKETSELFAIKMFDSTKLQKSLVYQEMLIDEIQCLRKISHQRIVRFHEWFKTSNHIYLTYDFCYGGNLDEVIKHYKFLQEDVVLSHVFKQIIEGFLIIKKSHIIHNDIKPSNILFKQTNMGTGPQSQLLKNDICIADFGFCKYVGEFDKDESKIISQELTTAIRGSPIYMAPEIIQGSTIDYSSDVYSLGVVFYEMLQGACPFEDTVIESLLIKKKECKLAFPHPISEFAQQLCRSMLEVDPKKRITIEEVANLIGVDILKINQEYLNSQIQSNSVAASNAQASGNNQLDNQYQQQRMNSSKVDYSTISQVDGNQQEDNQKIKNYQERRKIKHELGLGEKQATVGQNDAQYEKLQRIMSQSNTSKESILEVNKKIIKQRNKMIYVNNMISAVIDLNLYENSVLVVLILMKQMQNLCNKLIAQIRSTELTDFKISPSHWSKYKMSSDYETVLNYLLIEQKEIQKNVVTFIERLSPEEQSSFEKIESSLSSSTTSFTSTLNQTTNLQENENYIKVLKEYCTKVKDKAIEFEKQDKKQISYRMLMHLNNVLDGFDIDTFFSKFMIDGIKRLSYQTYFRVIESFSYEDFVQLINFKLQKYI
ncbi:hypothetical protein ABPG72_011829 [Tetrahymena utriculariae]